jgi:enterochelin esterase-like enzyme
MLKAAGSIALLVSATACAAPARLAYTRYDSAVMRAPAEYAVYTPPGFRPEERLPLVVFLHGGGDSERSFDQHGVGQALDRAIAAGEVPRVVVVVPDGDLGFWIDWHDGSRPFETWVVDEVVPRVAREHRTAPCPDGCHVVGVSMGASGALRVALHHSDRFASVAILSGPVFDTEQMIDFANDRLFSVFIPTHRAFGPTEARDRWRIRQSDPFVRWRSPVDLGTRLFLGWAEHDREGIVRGNRRLVRHLEQHGIPHVYREFPGAHGWAAWKPVLLEVLATHVRVPEDTPVEPPASD